MTRKEKIQLLKDLSSGKITLAEFQKATSTGSTGVTKTATIILDRDGKNRGRTKEEISKSLPDVRILFIRRRSDVKDLK